MKNIIIKTYQPEASESSIFRLQPDAARIIRQHQRASGLSASYILSEIVRQSKDYVVFTSQDMEADAGEFSESFGR